MRPVSGLVGSVFPVPVKESTQSLAPPFDSQPSTLEFHDREVTRAMYLEGGSNAMHRELRD